MTEKTGVARATRNWTTAHITCRFTNNAQYSSTTVPGQSSFWKDVVISGTAVQELHLK